jgi:hypothetical protein
MQLAMLQRQNMSKMLWEADRGSRSSYYMAVAPVDDPSSDDGPSSPYGCCKIKIKEHQATFHM